MHTGNIKIVWVFYAVVAFLSVFLSLFAIALQRIEFYHMPFDGRAEKTVGKSNVPHSFAYKFKPLKRRCCHFPFWLVRTQHTTVDHIAMRQYNKRFDQSVQMVAEFSSQQYMNAVDGLHFGFVIFDSWTDIAEQLIDWWCECASNFCLLFISTGMLWLARNFARNINKFYFHDLPIKLPTRLLYFTSRLWYNWSGQINTHSVQTFVLSRRFSLLDLVRAFTSSIGKGNRKFFGDDASNNCKIMHPFNSHRFDVSRICLNCADWNCISYNHKNKHDFGRSVEYFDITCRTMSMMFVICILMPMKWWNWPYLFIHFWFEWNCVCGILPDRQYENGMSDRLTDGVRAACGHILCVIWWACM